MSVKVCGEFFGWKVFCFEVEVYCWKIEKGILRILKQEKWEKIEYFERLSWYKVEKWEFSLFPHNIFFLSFSLSFREKMKKNFPWKSKIQRIFFKNNFFLNFCRTFLPFVYQNHLNPQLRKFVFLPFPSSLLAITAEAC